MMEPEAGEEPAGLRRHRPGGRGRPGSPAFAYFPPDTPLVPKGA